MDKSWMNESRLSTRYDQGVNAFLDFAFTHVGNEQEIVCPCVKCRLMILVTREVAYDHLICDGFVDGYTKWELHGEGPSCVSPHIETIGSNSTHMDIDMHGLLHDAFGMEGNVRENNTRGDEEEGDRQNPEAAKFYKLVEDSEKELYPGCKNFTMLSFVVQLYHIKCLSGVSNNHFNMLFELFKSALPEGETLPKSLYEMKKLIKHLGLNYEKIHACPNDCILYTKEYKDDVECHICKKSRYVAPEAMSSTKKSSKVPAKFSRYFPLIPRLKRKFMSSKTAPSMKWHKDSRTFDGHMKHPADSPAWITFDHKYPDFSSDSRNVRLALASDGMNPFGTMSISHSTWPVVLVPLNLPPWMCMKPSRCVNLKQRKIYGLKSHDCHILMTQLLPLAVRGLLDPHVSSCLNELSTFFRELYSKDSTPQDFQRLQKNIPVILCKLEKMFTPAFFDIMVHLMVHLPSEALIACPVQYRDMYPIERYLKKLKSFVRSKSHPEGSIAETYLADECLTFCSGYIKNFSSRFTNTSRRR